MVIGPWGVGLTGRNISVDPLTAHLIINRRSPTHDAYRRGRICGAASTWCVHTVDEYGDKQPKDPPGYHSRGISVAVGLAAVSVDSRSCSTESSGSPSKRLVSPVVTEHVLEHEGVDVDQGPLLDPQTQHGKFLSICLW